MWCDFRVRLRGKERQRIRAGMRSSDHTIGRVRPAVEWISFEAEIREQYRVERAGARCPKPFRPVGEEADRQRHPCGAVLLPEHRRSRPVHCANSRRSAKPWGELDRSAPAAQAKSEASTLRATSHRLRRKHTISRGLQLLVSHQRRARDSSWRVHAARTQLQRRVVIHQIPTLA